MTWTRLIPKEPLFTVAPDGIVLECRTAAEYSHAVLSPGPGSWRIVGRHRSAGGAWRKVAAIRVDQPSAHLEVAELAQERPPDDARPHQILGVWTLRPPTPGEAMLERMTSVYARRPMA